RHTVPLPPDSIDPHPRAGYHQSQLLENPADSFFTRQKAVAQFSCHGDSQLPEGWGAIEQFRDSRGETLGLLPQCKWLTARKLIAI
ncbi:MAG: hypothetical protein ACK523_10705, partial [Pirellulaceae bacterium]